MTRKKSSAKTPSRGKKSALLRVLRFTHDGYFREIFELERIGRMFLKKVLFPETLACLDLDKLTVEKRFLKDNLFKEMIADVMYRVPIKNSQEYVDFFVVLEHKSYSDTLAIFQLWGYIFQLCYRLLQAFLAAKAKRKARTKMSGVIRLPPVIAIIIHHGKSRFTGPTELAELFFSLPGLKKFLPHLRAILFDLSVLEDDDPLLTDPKTLELNVILMVLKTIFREEAPLTLPKLLLKLKPFSDDPTTRRIIRATWIYLISRAKYMEQNYEKIFASFQEVLKTQEEGEENEMPTMIEIWKAQGKAEGEAKGKAEGEAKGKAEGEAKGKAETVIRLLVRKWNKVPKPLVKQIRAITNIKKLDQLFDLAFDCDSLEEFAKHLS